MAVDIEFNTPPHKGTYKGRARGGSRIFIGEGLQVQEAPPGPGGAPF